MKTQNIFIAIILLAAVASIGYIYYSQIKTSENGDLNQSNLKDTVTEVNNGVANKAMEKLNSINIQQNSFNPSKLTVKKNATVTWTNLDSTMHTVNGDKDQTYVFENSQMLNQNETYKFTFNEVGTFNYHCHEHPEMKGQIEIID